MHLKNIMLYLPLLLGPVIAFGQVSSPALSIREAIEFAQQHNSNIKISRYDEEISRQLTNEVKGRGLPQVNINGSFEDRLKLPLLVIPGGFGGSPAGSESRGIPLGYQYNSNLAGEVTQMLYDQSFWLGLKAAKYRSQLAQQSTQQVKENTAYNVANAYYQAIVVQKQLQLLKSNLANTQKTLTTAEVQLKNGVARRVDVNRLRVNANNLESQISQAGLNLEQALHALKFQMGMPQEQAVALRDTALALRQDEAVLANALDKVYENRIEFKLLQTNLELQELDMKNTRAGFYPTLRGFGNYGYQSQGADFGLFNTGNNGWVDFTTSSVGVRLSIPLFDGLQRNARVAQSKLKVKQLEENINLTKQNINLDLANALTQYRNTLQRIQAEQQNVDLAQEVYAVTQLELREGVGTSNNVVEAETALRQAQNTYITTLLNLYTARLDLERAKGTLLPYLNSN